MEILKNNEYNSGYITGKCKKPEGAPWIHNAVFYQIYPQTFLDTNGDGIGDLQGIIDKLDYIKSLGVDAIWINPFFESPFNDAGYDISDYYKIAKRYGSNEDAKRLFEEAHKKGLKVIFDFVASYSSIDNSWFQESAKQEVNKYTNWYIWTSNTWENVPEPYTGKFVQGYSRRDGQFMNNFFWSQPALNYGFSNPDPTRPWQLPIDHPDVLAMREEMKNVVRFWMDLGADGFRADMAGALTKSTNYEGNSQFFNTKADGTLKFWTEVRNILDEEYPGSFMVAEWSHPEAAIEAGFHADFFHWFKAYNDLLQKESWRILNGFSEGHSFFDKEGKGNITNFLKEYIDQYEKSKDKGYVCLPIGNHDLSRLNIERSDSELEMLFAFSLCMPGIPFIYYGNEIGMKQLYGNPHVEGAYEPRSGSRTPMQWSKSKNAGFSSAPEDKIYLPIDKDEDFPNVEEQEKDPNSLLNKVRKLVNLKKEEKALSSYAEFVPLYAKENAYPFVFARAFEDEVVLIAVNPSQNKCEASFKANIVLANKKLLSGIGLDITEDKDFIKLEIPSQSYSIYKVNRK